MGRLSGQVSRSSGASRCGQRGAVYVEVVTCIVVLMVLFLCAVQLAFVGAGRLVVIHAATRGARAAIVLLEDAPDQLGGAPRGDLSGGGGGGRGAMAEALADSAPAGLVPSGSSSGGARLQAIREAAYAPLAALAPAPRVFLAGRPSTLQAAVGGASLGGALGRFALGLLAYVRGAAVVTVRAAPGSDEVLTRVEPRANVTVHVTFLQHCAVPIAARLMCDPAWDLAGYGRVLPELRRLDPERPLESARVMRQLRARFPDPGQAKELTRELARAESPGLLLPLMLNGARFKVIQAEATLPNQGAAYYTGAEAPVASR